MADGGWQVSGRLERYAAKRKVVRESGRNADPAVERFACLHALPDREDVAIRSWARAGTLRSQDGRGYHPQTGGVGLPLPDSDLRNCTKSPVPATARRNHENGNEIERGCSTMITGKSLARRTFLRGVGAAVGLPFLEAMTPAFAASSKSAKPPVRMAF